MTCPGCYRSFSGPWCDNCDQWPCTCLQDRPIVEGDDEGKFGTRPVSTFDVYESKEQLDELIEQDRQQMLIVDKALKDYYRAQQPLPGPESQAEALSPLPEGEDIGQTGESI